MVQLNRQSLIIIKNAPGRLSLRSFFFPLMWMKLKPFLPFIAFLSVINLCHAQYPHRYSVALTPGELIVGKHKKGNDSFNTILDTIEASKLQSIYAIDAFYFDKQHEIYSPHIVQFEMMSISGSDTLNLEATSSLLTQEMKQQLSKVRSGDFVYLQGILIEYYNGNRGGCSPLFFVVK
jgi:hypothetical protein